MSEKHFGIEPSPDFQSTLDTTSTDPSFPSDGAVELVFARGEGTGGAAPAPTPAAPLRAAPDALARTDSLEHLRPLSTITDDDPGKCIEV